MQTSHSRYSRLLPQKQQIQLRSHSKSSYSINKIRIKKSNKVSTKEPGFCTRISSQSSDLIGYTNKPSWSPTNKLNRMLLFSFVSPPKKLEDTNKKESKSPVASTVKNLNCLKDFMLKLQSSLHTNKNQLITLKKYTSFTDKHYDAFREQINEFTRDPIKKNQEGDKVFRAEIQEQTSNDTQKEQLEKAIRDHIKLNNLPAIQVRRYFGDAFKRKVNGIMRRSKFKESISPFNRESKDQRNSSTGS